MAATVMASMTSLAIAATAGTRAAGGAFPASALAHAPRRRALVVNAQSEDPAEPTAATTTTTTASTTTSPPSPSSPAAAMATPTTSKPNKETTLVSTLRAALAFTGPAPERINGRVAMVGFVASLAVEALRGGGDDADLLSQASCGTGIACFVATAAVLTVASLVPMLKGDDSAEDDRSGGGVMSADAELWNGRLAMLGILALAVTEYLTGVPFVSEIIGALS